MAYGAEIFNSSGTKIIELSSRVARFVAQGTTTVPSSGSIDITVTGMENNDSWGVFYASNIGAVSVNISKSTDTLTFTNPGSGSRQIDYWIIRS